MPGRRNNPFVLASNLLFLIVIPLVVLWPVTGDAVWGILALAALLLSGSLAGVNASRRTKRKGAAS